MNIFAAIIGFFRKPKPAAIIVSDVKSAVSGPGYDAKMVQIIKLCRARLNRERFTEEMCAGLAEPTIDWICTLSVEMLLSVTNTTQMRLRDHMKGRKSIRGVLAFDPISVAEYKEAMKPKIPVIDHGGQRGGGGGPKGMRR